MQALLAAVQVAYELDYAAFGPENMAQASALVNTFNHQAAVQISQLLESFFQYIVGKFLDLENFLVRLETHGGAVTFHIFANDGQGILGHAALVMLAITLAIATHCDGKVFGKSVDAAHANAVQAARNLVALVVELAPRVQLGHDHLNGRNLFLGMDIHRNAATVVPHRNGIVRMQDDIDFSAKSGHGLVYGIIDDFIDQVVQTSRINGTNIHCRPFAHGGKAFENYDR